MSILKFDEKQTRTFAIQIDVMNSFGKKIGTKTFESDNAANLEEFYNKYSYKPGKKKKKDS